MAKAHFLAALLCTLICWSAANVPVTKEPNTTVAPTTEEPQTTVAPTTKEPQPTKPAHKLPKAIEEFNDAFKNILKNSPILTEMFDLDLYCEPEEYAAGLFYNSASLHADLGSKNVVEDANDVIRYIPDNSKKLGDDVVIAVYSDSLAKYLFSEKILNTKNAEKLAQLYVKENNETYSKVANLNYRRSQILSLSLAYVQFITKNFKVDSRQSDKISKVFGNEWKYQTDIGAVPDADRRYPEIRSPVNNELLEPSSEACKTSNAAQQFAESLVKHVQSSRALSDLFRVGKNVSVHRGISYVSQFLLQKFGVKDSAILADFKAKYVDDEKARDPSVLTSVFAHSVGKYVESKKILNSKNARKLSQMYANALEEAAKRISRNYSPRSKIVALEFGIGKFYQQLNVFGPEDGKDMAFFCGNEWYCRSKFNL